MKFNNNQLKAINHFNGNCVVLASAGSGKTSVLVERVKRLVVNHNIKQDDILAITFSKKAATNMIDRLGRDYKNVNILTFHALGYRVLKENQKINYKTQLLKDWEKRKIITDICVKSLGLEASDDDVDVVGISAFISKQKNNLIKPEDTMVEVKDMPYRLDTMRIIFGEYFRQLKSQNKIDFDDMIYKAYYLLYNDQEICRSYALKFKYILIDEMQDTNTAQYEMIKLLGKPNNNVFVVGDPLQCIYEWRGCNNNYIIKFCDDWKNTVVINLNTNYRSSKNIVDFSNSLVKGTKETSHKYYVESESFGDYYKEPILKKLDDEDVEAEYIGENIERLQSDYECGDISILTRTNFQLQVIEKTLYEKNIPYEIIGGTTFYELKEVQDMLGFLALIYDKNNNDVFKRIYNTPNRYLGKVFMGEIERYAKSHHLSLYDSMSMFPRNDEWRYRNGILELYSLVNRDYSKYDNIGDIIKYIRMHVKYDKYIKKFDSDNNDINEKIENLDTLVDFAKDFNDLGEFLNEIKNITTFQNDKENQDKNRVQLMTIHKSKGLEFPCVFVAGVSNGILPHANSDNINEEKRLLYVAVTRAEKELFITSPQMYNDKLVGESMFLKKDNK